MDIDLELAEYLMNELASTYADFDNDSTFAFSVITNIAIVGNNIPESLMRLYTAPVVELIGSEMTQSCISYFHGASILSVNCDCAADADDCLISDLDDNLWYLRGRKEALDGSPMYNRAMTDVTALRHAIY